MFITHRFVADARHFVCVARKLFLVLFCSFPEFGLLLRIGLISKKLGKIMREATEAMLDPFHEKVAPLIRCLSFERALLPLGRLVDRRNQRQQNGDYCGSNPPDSIKFATPSFQLHEQSTIAQHIASHGIRSKLLFSSNFRGR